MFTKTTCLCVSVGVILKAIYNLVVFDTMSKTTIKKFVDN